MPVVIDVTPPATPPTGPCADKQVMVDAYLAAEKAVLDGLSVRWGERSLTRVNLPDIVKERRQWEDRLAKCLAGCSSAKMGNANVSLASLNSDGCGGVEGGERTGWNIDPCCR